MATTSEVLWRLATDQAAWGLLLSAVGLQLYSCYRAIEYERLQRRVRSNCLRPGDPAADADMHHGTTVLDQRTVFLVPVVASVTLLVFFFFLEAVSFVYLSAIIAISFVQVDFAFRAQVCWAVHRCGGPKAVRVPLLGAVDTATLVVRVVALVLVGGWTCTGAWLLNNVIAASFVINGLALLRLPNLRLAALLLALLFVYDIWWVFGSEMVFGKNVMVTVAAHQGQNPAAAVAPSLVVPQLDLPMKMMWPRSDGRGFTMLGLGDIVMPGLALVVAAAADDRAGRRLFALPLGIFGSGAAGYTAGLVVTVVVVNLYHVAQPALIYLVPATLGAICVAASRLGTLGEVWRGPAEPEDEPDEGQHA